MKATTIPVRHIASPSRAGKSVGENFVIRSLEQFLNRKDLDEDIHRHDFFLVLVLEKGVGYHQIDFKSYPVKDHTVFFVRPGQVHRLQLKLGSKGYLLQFDSRFYYSDAEFVKRLLKKVSSNPYYVLPKDKFSKIQQSIKQVEAEYNEMKDEFVGVIKANLVLFFIELVRSNAFKMEAKITNSYSQERLEEFLYLLETKIRECKSVSEYAAMLSLSPYQLNATTKTILGKTCTEMIMEQVVLESKRHLLATTSTVKEIAFELGYDDVSYFTRLFKKRTGFSPEAFRKKFK